MRGITALLEQCFPIHTRRMVSEGLEVPSRMSARNQGTNNLRAKGVPMRLKFGSFAKLLLFGFGLDGLQILKTRRP